MQCQKLKTNMETGRVIFLPIRAIHPNPAQPRRNFSREALEQLADSIGKYGILQPLTVRRTAGGYELIAGERRLRAAVMAGLGEAPCLVMQMDDRESELAAMVENLQRQDLDFIEEAMGLQRMMQMWGFSQEQAARAVGKSQSAVANKLRILQHSEGVLSAMRENSLTERHARALLKITGDEKKLELISLIRQKELSVVQTETLIRSMEKELAPKAGKGSVSAFLNSLSSGLQRIQMAGIPAISERKETDSQIVFTITIPKDAAETCQKRKKA